MACSGNRQNDTDTQDVDAVSSSSISEENDDTAKEKSAERNIGEVIPNKESTRSQSGDSTSSNSTSSELTSGQYGELTSSDSTSSELTSGQYGELTSSDSTSSELTSSELTSGQSGDSTSSDSTSSELTSSELTSGQYGELTSSSGESSNSTGSKGLQPKHRGMVASPPVLHKLPNKIVASKTDSTKPTQLVTRPLLLPKRLKLSGSVRTSGSLENEDVVKPKTKQPPEKPKDPATVTKTKEDTKLQEEKVETVEYEDNEPYTDPVEIYLPPVPVHTVSDTPSFSYDITEEEGGYANINLHTNGNQDAEAREKDIDYEPSSDLSNSSSGSDKSKNIDVTGNAIQPLVEETEPDEPTQAEPDEPTQAEPENEPSHSATPGTLGAQAKPEEEIVTIQGEGGTRVDVKLTDEDAETVNISIVTETDHKVEDL